MIGDVATAATSLELEQKRALVDRVAKSASFRRSPRLRAFLLYVADCVLNGRPEDAREQHIAQHVFNRRPDYNAGQDNIVRVEARSLRKRLDAYFATDGKDEPVVIVMPKGTYAIGFENRSAEEVPSAPEPAPVPPAAGHAESGAGATLSLAVWRFRMLLGIIACLVFAAGAWLWLHPGKVELSAATGVLPFSALIDNGLDTYIVTSDTSLVLIEQLTRRHVDLKDYVAGRYPPGASLSGASLSEIDTGLLRSLSGSRYTDAEETAVAGRILQMNGRLAHHTYLRSGHEMRLSDFRDHNVILLGGMRGNPWTELYAGKLNFQSDVRDDETGILRNRSPRAGEKAEYFTPAVSVRSTEAYASVAFVPNVSGSGSALLIAGTTPEATATAGAFVLDPVRISKALRAIGIDPAGPRRYFELLLGVTASPGGAVQPRVVASRLVPEPK